MKTRSIARVDIKNEYVIKGIHLEGLRKVGNPKDLIQKYYKEGIKEIMIMDCVASLYGRNSLFDFLKEISNECFVPITIGGGLKTINDVELALHSGADKVYINSELVRNPSVISEIIKMYGSQVLVAGVDAKKISETNWKVLIESGREETGLDALDWVAKLCEFGVGEIAITSIDSEGCKNGFDIELINKVSQISSVPIIVSGGCGNLTHIKDLVEKTYVEGVAFASVLHYNILNISDINKELE